MTSDSPSPRRTPSSAYTRRTVTRGAAWTVPLVVVSVAAPAFAASPSPCTSPASFRLDWGTTPYTKNTTTNVGTATVSTTGGALPVVVTLTSVITGTVNRHTENLTWQSSPSNLGGLGAAERGLALSHTDISSGRGNRQTVTIEFSRAVTGLSFTMVDIDSDNRAGSNDFWDQVELSGTRNAVTATHVTGAGTLASPWHYDDNDTSLGDTSTQGIVTVTYPGAVSTITLDYWSSARGGNQWILLSDFTFKAACS